MPTSFLITELIISRSSGALSGHPHHEMFEQQIQFLRIFAKTLMQRRHGNRVRTKPLVKVIAEQPDFALALRALAPVCIAAK